MKMNLKVTGTEIAILALIKHIADNYCISLLPTVQPDGTYTVTMEQMPDSIEDDIYEILIDYKGQLDWVIL